MTDMVPAFMELRPSSVKLFLNAQTMYDLTLNISIAQLEIKDNCCSLVFVSYFL